VWGVLFLPPTCSLGQLVVSLPAQHANAFLSFCTLQSGVWSQL